MRQWGRFGLSGLVKAVNPEDRQAPLPPPFSLFNSPNIQMPPCLTLIEWEQGLALTERRERRGWVIRDGQGWCRQLARFHLIGAPVLILPNGDLTMIAAKLEVCSPPKPPTCRPIALPIATIRKNYRATGAGGGIQWINRFDGFKGQGAAG